MKDHPSPHTSQARRGALKGGRSSTSPTLAPGPRTGVAILCLLPLLLAACGSGSDGDPGAASSASSAPSSSSSAPPSSSAAPTSGTADLVVVVDPGDGSAPRRYTLTCGTPPTGDLPDPAAACATLRALPDPLAPLPTDQVCSEQYGGPQTAQVTGRWAGEDVDLSLARTNGCQISQWDRLGPLLPGAGG